MAGNDAGTLNQNKNRFVHNPGYQCIITFQYKTDMPRALRITTMLKRITLLSEFITPVMRFNTVVMRTKNRAVRPKGNGRTKRFSTPKASASFAD
jgi:hypothetical protein